MFMSFQIQQIWAVYFSGVNDLRCPNCQPSLRLREVIDIGIVAKLNVSGNQIESGRKIKLKEGLGLEYNSSQVGPLTPKQAIGSNLEVFAKNGVILYSLAKYWISYGPQEG